MPEAFVVALIVCAPSVKTTSRPATGWPRSSTTCAVSVTFLLGLDEFGPVYVVVLVRWTTTACVVDVPHACSGSHAVSVAVYVPGAGYAWLALAPPEALGDPSPKFQLYDRNGCSSVPGSSALPFSATGTPHSEPTSGPAFAVGARLAITTLKDAVPTFPSPSVMLSWPLYVPGPWNVCCGLRPNATPPSEKCQTTLAFPRPQTLELAEPSNDTGVPSTPLYGPPALAVGAMVFASTGPRSTCWSGADIEIGPRSAPLVLTRAGVV